MLGTLRVKSRPRLIRPSHFLRFNRPISHSIPVFQTVFQRPKQHHVAGNSQQVKSTKGFRAPKAHVKDMDMFRIERYVQGSRERGRLLRKVARDDLTAEEVEKVYWLFNTALDTVSIEISAENHFMLACDIWDRAFFRLRNGETEITPLQALLLQKRKILVHTLIDYRNYAMYERLIRPLFKQGKRGVLEKEWCDVLAETIQFDVTDLGETKFNREAIESFLTSDDTPIEQKRSMLAVFTRRGLHFQRARDVQAAHGDEHEILQCFVEFMTLIQQDSHLLLVNAEHKQYKPVMFSIIEYLNQSDTDGALVLEDIFTKVHKEGSVYDKVFNNFLSTLIKVSSEGLPLATIKFWNYKVLEAPRMLTSSDLTNTMMAYYNLRNFTRVMELSKTYIPLYHEEQLVILLKVSDATKDWESLQDQFDFMYGKGHLPYAEHYSVVMNALAHLGVKKEVDRLFAQLKKRNIAPTPSIYRALVVSRITAGQLVEARAYFDQFIQELPSMPVRDLQVSDLYRTLFSTYLSSNDRDELLKFFQSSVYRQRTDNISIIDTKMIVQAIEYFIECYGFKEVRYLHQIAEMLDLLDESVYCKLATAYTTFSQYSLAEELIAEAHRKSLVPFRNPLVLKAQLRNYTTWFVDTNNAKEKAIIWHSRERVIRLARSQNVTSHFRHHFYAEVIRYFVTRKMMGSASSQLRELMKRGPMMEDFYVPFLQHYSNSNIEGHHEKVLDYYKDMVQKNVRVSIRTYEPLFKSVLFLDTANNDYHNSDKMIQSVLETYGMDPSFLSRKKPKDAKPLQTSSLVLDEFVKAAPSLCRMVCLYVRHKPSPVAEKEKMLTKLLRQLDWSLSHRMKYRLKITIYKEMAKAYQNLHNVAKLKSVVAGGVQELQGIISKFHSQYPVPYEYPFEVILPRGLQDDYSALMAMQMKIMAFEAVSPSEYLPIAQFCEKYNVRLSGKGCNFLIEQLMKLDNWKGLHNIMDIVDNYLAMGTINEVAFRRYMKHIYRLFILQKSEVISEAGLASTYRIFNDLYSLKSIKAVKDSFPPQTDVVVAMKTALMNFNARFYGAGDWSYDYVMKNPEIFFSPEKRLDTSYRVNSSTLWKLSEYVARYCDGDRTKLFDLADKYPAAVDCMVEDFHWRPKISKFRSEINSVVNPPQNAIETFHQRRERTSKALKKIFGKTDKQ